MVRGVNWDAFGAGQLTSDIEGGAGTSSATKAQNWPSQNRQVFIVEPAGADVESKDVAGWLFDYVTGVMGAVPAVQKAVVNLQNAAAQMRATAASYGVTEEHASWTISHAATA